MTMKILGFLVYPFRDNYKPPLLVSAFQFTFWSLEHAKKIAAVGYSLR
jgi:hypothetical protein